jgi:hypothetical protein
LESTRDRLEAMWQDYDRYGGPADPAKAQPPNARWSLAFCLIQHFGRLPWLVGTPQHRAGGLGWDPCLPEPGTQNYEIIEAVVLVAEKIIGKMPQPLDKRLCGYQSGRRVSSRLNAHWANPLQAMEGSDELREGLIATLRAATLAAK